ncbi:VOC family protein [Streptomyces sp. LX-29]|uniref:VOC family protein n=1 Tax=Streptomyces sp. LX-29 TaxID=2900152 RepID=UPI00321B31CE
MLTTDFQPGSPCWLDLGAPDTDAAAAFYGELFGWEFHSLGSEAMGYGFFQQGGKTVCALGPLMDEDARSAWTLYFQTADADATTKAVEQAGGVVRVAPMDVFTEGRLAAYTDPAGAEFAVWQPGDTRGVDVVNDPGTLCWSELHTPDPAGARAFYGSVFGWDTEDMPMDGFTYTVLSTAGGGREAAFGGSMPEGPDEQPRWLPYFEVADADAIVARAQELGGRVVLPAATAEGIGRMARLADRTGRSSPSSRATTRRRRSPVRGRATPVATRRDGRHRAGGPTSGGPPGRRTHRRQQVP